MNISKKEYQKMVKSASPASKKLLNAVKAFLIGGLICALGQGIFIALRAYGADEQTQKLVVPSALIVLTAVLTMLGVFDRIGKHAGAGTFVPITGFANSIVSPAMEFRSEGHVLGTGAEMFRIAGPVLVYGGTAAAVYGLFYWIFY